jgi:TPR repeat protein
LAAEIGCGTSQSWEQAVKSYSEAADLGYAPAQHNLALLLRKGQGTAPDAKRAYELDVRAAEQGLPSAAATLGAVLILGMGTPVDRVRGGAWLFLAQEAGYTDHVAASLAELTQAELQAAQIQAAAWQRVKYGPAVLNPTRCDDAYPMTVSSPGETVGSVYLGKSDSPVYGESKA